MVLLDVLGQRWTLRILWELRLGRASFRDLRRRCDDISPTILNGRLKQLRRMQLVDLTEDGYGYTKQGRQLSEQFVQLDQWAEKWACKLSAPPPSQ
jgi:DNA-binding HxlR family transcriptional regulator